MKQQYKIGMISLGCPKNQVDAEQILGVLAGHGYEITADQAQADVIVVNTCGFIESAKEESIEAILDAAKMKKKGRCRALVVAGCLAQRYKRELADDLPEADAIIGTAEIPRIAEIADAILEQRSRIVTANAPALVFGLPRIRTTASHSRYLKIAEGCSNRCAYCAIPFIRGNFASRPVNSIVEEAKRLADEGAKELILLSQDSTQYMDSGIDLPRLLSKVAKVGGIKWLRLMYVYPGRMTDELIGAFAEEEKLCRYLDMPVQHIDDGILAAMNRRSSADDIKRTIEQVREKVPGISLRTSLIVGFPGETEAAFKRLLAFVKEYEFEHLGVFTYSAEDGTPAADLPGRVPKKVAEMRRENIMQTQAKISLKKNKALIGTKQTVLVDALEDLALIGRLETQAPEIDGVVYLSEIEASPGNFVEVTITDAREYDLLAEAGKRKISGWLRRRQKT